MLVVSCHGPAEGQTHSWSFVPLLSLPKSRRSFVVLGGARPEWFTGMSAFPGRSIMPDRAAHLAAAAHARALRL
jgi:hypothetical protein